jgi:hypothetical protein
VGLKVLADLILRPARSRRYFTNSTWSGASPSALPAVLGDLDESGNLRAGSTLKPKF